MYPGIFNAGLQTKSETMAAGVEAVKEEISGIIDNPPSDDEMNRAKESILNSFVFRYDSRSEILGQQMLYAYYGLPSDFLEMYRVSIEKVTKEDVTRVAKEYEAAGVDMLLCLINPWDISHEDCMQTIELMGKYVIPEFEK